MKRLFLTMVFGLILSGCKVDNSTMLDQREFVFSERPVFIIAGQSNSVSPAQKHAPHWSKTGRVTLNDYYHEGQYGSATLFRIPTEDDPMDGSISWIYLGDYLDRDVTFINVGAGGTNTKKWKDYLYKRITAQLDKWADVDAILWVQGESDIVEGFTEEDTYENLKEVILKTREINPDVKWFIAINSYTTSPTDPPTDNSVRRAEKRIIEEGLAYSGPDTDTIRINYDWMEGGAMVGPGAEFAGEGLKEHGRLWYEVLKNYL